MSKKVLLREQLEEMTHKELDAYASDYLNVATGSITSKSEKVELILRVNPLGATEMAVPVAEKNINVGPDAGYIRVKIARDGQDKRQRPVFLGHNLKGYLVKRDKAVDLPADVVVSSLGDAIELAPVWDDEVATATGQGGMILAERQSYPFQVIAFGPGTDAHKTALGYDD